MKQQTSDKAYADLLVMLQSMPATKPAKPSLSKKQAKVWEYEDLLKANGEAKW